LRLKQGLRLKFIKQLNKFAKLVPYRIQRYTNNFPKTVGYNLVGKDTELDFYGRDCLFIKKHMKFFFKDLPSPVEVVSTSRPISISIAT
jgi:hypothetical protein